MRVPFLQYKVDGTDKRCYGYRQDFFPISKIQSVTSRDLAIGSLITDDDDEQQRLLQAFFSLQQLTRRPLHRSRTAAAGTRSCYCRWRACAIVLHSVDGGGFLHGSLSAVLSLI
ncbi:hypothetical protein J6590_042867 [Homalodisca vitripennis]|nr:hypothetical protein J6590_042867 [Homalodisca vitripennis]